MNALNKENEKFAVATTLFGEIFSTNSETFRMTLALNNLANSYKKESYQNIKSRVINQLNGMYKDYDAALDQTISAELIEYYNTTMPKDLLPKKVASAEEIQTVLDNTLINGTATINGKTLLTSLEELSKNDDEFIKAIQQDPLVLLVKRYLDTYQEKVSTQYLANQNKMNQLMRTYMKAQLEVFSDQKLFPDANSTLRVTYGKVDGYQPRDAVYYEPVTYLDGVVEKHIPGDYEFDLPQPLIDLYNKKDFGKYADKNGKLPVNFIATNHTTGGNSGSPAIDGNGNLVGLNFDRVWEGTMSDLNYDPEICRNIMVDARYILWVIEKYGKADHLIKEMKIVTK